MHVRTLNEARRRRGCIDAAERDDQGVHKGLHGHLRMDFRWVIRLEGHACMLQHRCGAKADLIMHWS